MKVKEKIRLFLICLLAVSVVMVIPAPKTVFAEEAEGEEAAEGENEGEEGGEGEEGEEGAELSPEEMQAALEVVTPSSIETNIDGKYLALTFPASSVPEGFSVITVDYMGEKVMLAQMTSKSSTIGAPGLTISLAYLTDPDGSNGEFYICDTTESARMSDMIMVNGAPGKYIIILDPGDNVVGPAGFKQRKLQWGSKTAVAWSLPEELPEEEGSSEEKGTDESAKAITEKDLLPEELVFRPFSVEVFAGEFNLTAGEAAAEAPAAGAGEADAMPEENGDSGDTEDKGEEDAGKGNDEADENAMIALDAIAHTNASGLIQAQPKEFCLLYAIDESANLGFFLYDIERGTYQRYVDIPKGESATLVKYRKLSRTRLFIIIVLAIILVIMLFILINTLVNRRGDRDYDEDEEDPEEEAMRQRAKVKERRNIGKRERAYLMDEEADEEFEDDYGDEDEDEDDEPEEEEEPEEVRPRSIIRRRSVTQGHELPQKRAMQEMPSEVKRSEKEAPTERNRAESEVDWESMEITAGLNPKKTRAAMKNASAKEKSSIDLDEDFDFEFIKIK